VNRIGATDDNRFLEIRLDGRLSAARLREIVIDAAGVLDFPARRAARFAGALTGFVERARREGMEGRLSLHAASGLGDRWLLARVVLEELLPGDVIPARYELFARELDLFECREVRPSVEANLGLRRRRAEPVDLPLLQALRARYAGLAGPAARLRLAAAAPAADRHRLEVLLEERLAALRGGGAPFCLALFAVDPLTADGHPAEAGLRRRADDAVLRVLPGRLRPQDRIIDYRGRVRALLMDDIELDEALSLVRRWNAVLRAVPVGRSHRLAASFGVVRAFPDEDAASLLHRASRALVRARQKGGGRVEPGLGDLERLGIDPARARGASGG